MPIEKLHPTALFKRHQLLIATLVAASAVVAAMAAPGVAAPPEKDPVIAAVGDIACQANTSGDSEGACRSGEVADLIESLAPDKFLMLGDMQYENASTREIENVYSQQFADLFDITAPAPGNHEYGTEGAQGYFDYFGAAANPPKGYYSFDLDAWHIISLNSDVCGDDPGCGPGTPQYEWLKSDLASSKNFCTMAFQHHPSKDWRPYQKWVEDDGTTQYGGSETAPYVDMWKLMDGAGVDVLLAAHNHIYQRWAPQDADGFASEDGIRQFTVGTGGRSLYPFGPKPKPENLVTTQNKAYGVIEMTLHKRSYDYRWVPVAGEPGGFTDEGTFSCV